MRAMEYPSRVFPESPVRQLNPFPVGSTIEGTDSANIAEVGLVLTAEWTSDDRWTKTPGMSPAMSEATSGTGYDTCEGRHL